MKDFLKKKIEILEYEAQSSGQSIANVFLIKCIKSLASLILDILDILLFILLSPIFLLVGLVCYWQKNSKKGKSAFFIGLEHVIDKTAERGRFLENEGFIVQYFSYEWTGKKAANYSPKIKKYSLFTTVDSLIYLIYILRYKPLYVEVYLEGKGSRQLLSVMLGKICKAKQIVIDRGLHYGMVHNMGLSPLMKILFLNTIRLSDFLFSREATVEESYEVYKNFISKDRIYYDHNRVPIKEEPFFDPNNKTVLFLNGFWKFRRMDLVVEAIPFVVQEIPEARFIFVGARNEQEMLYVKNLIAAKGIENYTEVYYWTQSPESFYKRAGIFVLPADRVFCNFSLLESMERGLVPIVAKVKDSEKVVVNNLNGFLVEQEPDKIAERIIFLLKNANQRQELSRQARSFIKDNYNSSKRMEPILNLLTQGSINKIKA